MKFNPPFLSQGQTATRWLCPAAAVTLVDPLWRATQLSSAAKHRCMERAHTYESPKTSKHHFAALSLPTLSSLCPFFGSSLHPPPRLSPSGLVFRSHFQPLVLLIFYSVSGGPFGVEPVVAAGGPLIALLGFMFLPLVWSIPEALVTAELSTTFPEAAGCVAWVRVCPIGVLVGDKGWSRRVGSWTMLRH